MISLIRIYMIIGVPLGVRLNFSGLVHTFNIYGDKPGTIARSVAMSLGHENILRPFFLFRRFKKRICQLMAKGWALSTGSLPRGGLPRNSVDRITDRPDMTSAVDRGRKALTQQQLNSYGDKKTFLCPQL